MCAAKVVSRFCGEAKRLFSILVLQSRKNCEFEVFGTEPQINSLVCLCCRGCF